MTILRPVEPPAFAGGFLYTKKPGRKYKTFCPAYVKLFPLFHFHHTISNTNVRLNILG